MINNEDFNFKEDDNFLNSENTPKEEVFEEYCPITDLMLSVLMEDKPFGITWKSDIIENFLIKRGYKIVSRHSELTDEDYKVAFKSDDPCIPETEADNTREIFSDEVQKILSNWLLKIGKEDE